MRPSISSGPQNYDLAELPTVKFTFPVDLCTTNLATKQRFPNMYYATRIIPNNLIVDMTLNLATESAIKEFQQFWYSDLNNGIEPFLIDLPIFGDWHEYTARFINDISATWGDAITPKTQKIQIEILNDIEKEFNQDRFRVLMTNPKGGEVSFFADGKVTVDWGYGLLDYYDSEIVTGTPFNYVYITSRYVIREFYVISGDLVETATVERALDVRNAEEMFKGLPLLKYLRFMNAPYFETIASIAEDTPSLCKVEGLTLESCVDATKAFKSSWLPTIDINTSNIQIFDEMFMNATNLKCIQRLNTLNQTSTTDMFTNTPSLLYPDATDQAALLAGADWESSVNCIDDFDNWMQNLIYDNDNIKSEFNYLVNVSLASNNIKATGDAAVAISRVIEPIEEEKVITLIGGVEKSQCTSDKDIDFKARFAYANISLSSSTADELCTSVNIQVGDTLIIVKDDDSINEMTVSSVEYPSYIADGSTNTSNVDATAGDTGTPSASYNSDNAKLAFNQDRNTLWDGGVPESYLVFSFKESTCINKYHLEEYAASNELDLLEWYIEASNDNINWAELDHVNLSNSVVRYDGSFTNGTEYTSYRIRTVRTIQDNAKSSRIGTFRLVEAQLDFGDNCKKIDTTIVTGGEVPSRAYAVGGGIEFDFSAGGGFVSPTIDHIDYELGVSPLDPNDPFEDGSMVARFPLDIDEKDALGNVSTTNNGVTFVDDDDLGRKVGEFGGGRYYIATDLKTVDDLNVKYTITFKAKRHSDNTYDVPYTELNDAGWRRESSGSHFQFDGDDCNSGGGAGSYVSTGQYSGKRSGGAAKTDICSIQDTKEWHRYTLTMDNGNSVKLFSECQLLVDNPMPYFNGGSDKDLSIGALVKDRGTDHYNFDGRMCDFAIFNRPLTQSEVEQLCKFDSKSALFATVYYKDLIFASGSSEVYMRVNLLKEGDIMMNMSAALFGKSKRELTAEDSIGGVDGTEWILPNILLTQFTLCKE